MSDSSVTELVVVNGKVRPVLPASAQGPVAQEERQPLPPSSALVTAAAAAAARRSAPAAQVVPVVGQLPSCEERLRRAARYTGDALELGSDTTRRLRVQGEQLAPMEYTLDNTDYELKQGHRLVRGITSWTGMFKNWFTRSPRPPERPSALVQDGSDAAAVTAGGSRGSPSVSLARRSRTTSRKAASASRDREAADSSYPSLRERHEGESYAELLRRQRQRAALPTGMNAREEQLLDILHEDVRRLGEQALVQQELLTQQNAQLDVIHDKTEKVHNRLEKVSRRVKEAL